MFGPILIANRGEIACRIINTAQKLNIQTIAIYSSVDKHAKHVQLADAAYHVGAAAAQDSYLNIAAIINIAKQAKANAIHPGYGFLAENYQFAERCEQTGIVFIGPPSNAIKQMGCKAAAKQLMAAAKVPLIPGYHGGAQDAATLQQAAANIGYPLLIKASKGGGGKGMRVVEHPAEFSTALASCQREAQAAFGNSEVILEKYLINPRHIEVQIFADNFGNVIHLFERDCSIQRRHQKIIEEAPAYNLSAEIRQQMGKAAVAAAQAINYRGAGTIEFLYSAPNFYFMEMNTRLQVEHPVTEFITDLDLVAWQIQISANQPLPLRQDQLAINGHAIEARIYAEDPERDFLPSTGIIEQINYPEGSGIRLDNGVQVTDQIGIYYDPLLAKLIVHAESRAAAVDKLQQALQQLHIIGVQTNCSFLRKIIQLDAYLAGKLSTKFIADHAAALAANYHSQPLTLALIGATIFAQYYNQLLLQTTARNLLTSTAQQLTLNSPWQINSNWRLNHQQLIQITLVYQEIEYFLQCQALYSNTTAKNSTLTITFAATDFTVTDICFEKYGSKLQLPTLSCKVNNTNYTLLGVPTSNGMYISFSNFDFHLQYPSQETAAHQHEVGTLNAPMPGIISKIFVSQGTQVAVNDPLLILEAMKMEHTIKAPIAGTIVSLPYNKGDIVEEGSALVCISQGAE